MTAPTASITASGPLPLVGDHLVLVAAQPQHGRPGLQVGEGPGELAWGGAASTFFWVDPAEQLTAIFLTQLLPSTTYPLRSELRQLVYQALVN